jgi:hypothetical protein
VLTYWFASFSSCCNRYGTSASVRTPDLGVGIFGAVVGCIEPVTVEVHVGATGNLAEQNACAAGESPRGRRPLYSTLWQTLPWPTRPGMRLKVGAGAMLE